MKAIIMAGGEGSRLRPLTCSCPKPMVSLMDKPVMSYALELLKRHGIREAAATLHYLPDKVRDYFGNGSEFGVSMRYYVEHEPLGTAGSVKQAQDFLTETFVVLSGDGVTDCDLTEAVKFHQSRKALATMILKRVENPLEYGVVISDADGRVRRFVEKPNWGEVFSDTVNTGIYILEPQVLEYIPQERSYDFGRELFPELVKAGAAVYAYTMKDYWCDIGDLSAYLKAHVDAMDGKINLPLPGRVGSVFRMNGARIDRGAILEGPCFVGEGAVVEAGARIGAYSVLGAGCTVGERASVKRSVLWRNARMKSGAQARGCVLGEGACMDEESNAFEESVLGDGATLGERSVLMPSVKVWPEKHISDAMRLDENLVWGGGAHQGFSAGRLVLKSPSQAARMAQAYASAIRPRNVLMGRAGSSVALSYALAVQSGLMAQGVQILDAGTTTLPQLRVMNHLLQSGGAVFVDGEGVRILDENGVELKAVRQRKVESLLMRQDYERAFAAVTKLPISAGRSDLMYAGYLLRHCDVETLGSIQPQLAVYASSEQLLSVAECVVEKCGCTVRAEWEEELMDLSRDEIGIWLTEGGEQMRLAGEAGSLTESENILIRVWTMLEQGEKHIVLPMGETHAAEALAARYHAQIVRVKGERAHFMQALIEESRHQLMMHFDGLYAALQCVGMLARQGMSLKEWVRQMPHLNRKTRSVTVEWKDKGRILAALLAEEADADMTDGMSIHKKDAWAWIAPSDERAECRIITEARSTEAAQELCDFYAAKIERLTGADAKKE